MMRAAFAREDQEEPKCLLPESSTPISSAETLQLLLAIASVQLNPSPWTLEISTHLAAPMAGLLQPPHRN